MRELEYEDNLLEFQQKLAASLAKVASPSDADVVVWGLTRKSWSHCEMALELIKTRANAEAIILLRAAYEAIIRAYFLHENPSLVNHYKAFSELSTLRNQLEVIDFLEKEGGAETDKEAIIEQKKLVEAQQGRIIKHKFHEVYNFKEEDLASLTALKRLTNNRNMPDFATTRSLIKKTALAKALLSTGFPIYNLGSQMAHSSFGMTMSFAYSEDNYPLYNEHSMYGYIFLILCCCCDLFNQCGALNDEAYSSLKMELKNFHSVMHLD